MGVPFPIFIEVLLKLLGDSAVLPALPNLSLEASLEASLDTSLASMNLSN